VACGEPSGRAAEGRAEIESPAALERLWRKVEAELPGREPPFLWRTTRTPALPLEWPPDGDTVWVRYEAAYGFDPTTISDGVRVAAPFARLVLDREGRIAEVEALPGRPRELGVQGVVPMKRPSGAIDGEWEQAVIARAAALDRLPEEGSRAAGELRAFVGSWVYRNGVLAGAVRGDHRAFLDWVGPFVDE
jgi:hypothetical protein